MRRLLSHFRISAATRLAIGLTMLCVSLLLASSFLGLLPDRSKIEAASTSRACESIALQMVAADPDDPDDLATLQAVLEKVIAREPGIDSVAMRTTTGKLLLQAGDHPQAAPEALEAGVLMVPIEQNGEAWADVEFRLHQSGALRSLVTEALIAPKLAIFLGGTCLVGFSLYLRRALKYLDPSAIVPERVRTAFDTMSEGVVLLDPTGAVVLANRAFLKMLGLEEDEVLGKVLGDMGGLASRDEAVTIKEVWEGPLTQSATVRDLLCRLDGADGEEKAVNVSAAPIRTDDQSPARGVLVTFDNVTELERRNTELKETVLSLDAARREIEKKHEAMEQLATRDPLTGVFNRRAFFNAANAIWTVDQRGGRSTAVIMMDIDHFKSVNDNHGHGRGDEVLTAVSRILARSLRTSDLVCRYGGEEFCVLLPDTTEEGALMVADDLRQRVANNTSFGFPVTVSAGAAARLKDEPNLEAQIDRADQALYRAKNAGRNRAVAWSSPAEAEAAGPAGPPAVREKGGSEMIVSRPAVVGLMTALEYRDPETAAHSRRVAALCVSTAGNSLSAAEAFVLEVAALLHDIGKVGVPDAILFKPGKLNQEEREIMNRHDVIGMEIVRSAIAFEDIAQIIRYHHTHYRALQASDVTPPVRSLAARAGLLSICDAYDAMTNDRPYREAMGVDDAYAELRRCGGEQFDPVLVDLFVARQKALLAGGVSEVADRSGHYMELVFGIERLAIAAMAGDTQAVTQAAGQLARLPLAEDPRAVEKIESIRQLTHGNELGGVLDALLDKATGTPGGASGNLRKAS